jgi:hypothetical protein
VLSKLVRQDSISLIYLRRWARESQLYLVAGTLHKVNRRTLPFAFRAVLLHYESVEMRAQSKFERLREKHPKFVYDSFCLDRSGGNLKVRFAFLLYPDISFNPEVTFSSIDKSRIESLDPRVLENLIFHLGLIEMLSYWKAACSPEVIIKAGGLNPEQIRWWKDLLLHGMREFFFANQIDFRRTDLIRFSAPARNYENPCRDNLPKSRALVLASGGKDTALTLQLLREAGAEFNCLMLNPMQPALAIAQQAGCADPIVVNRTIDNRLLELNKAGYLNGHTPFSAYLAFLGTTAAVLFGYGRLIVSNERSSNEGNTEFLSAQVNHQYSKSFRFERLFREYVKSYLASGLEYFSLLRPLYEIQIIRLLADYPQCLPLFKSCNRMQREGSWCGVCPKCISVFTLFYPFLAEEELISIFGRNLFEQEAVMPVLRQLAGLDTPKPFECVGTIDETIAALYLACRKTRRTAMPIALRYVEEKILPELPCAARLAEEVLSAWNEEHYLPPEYESLLKSRINRVMESQ